MELNYRLQLPEFIKSLKLPMIAVEVGVAEGFFSADLLRMGIDQLYMVDLWGHIPNIKGDGNFPATWHEKNFSDAMKRVDKYKERVTVLRGKSFEMAQFVPDESLGLVYIDADHSYDGCKGDIISYWPKLVQGGVMALHDYDNDAYGVKRAVEEFATDNKLVVHYIPENRKDDAGAYIIKP